jgi:hypothetical protein
MEAEKNKRISKLQIYKKALDLACKYGNTINDSPEHFLNWAKNYIKLTNTLEDK